MESSSSSLIMRKMVFILFISILIMINHVEATQARKILKTKSLRAKFSAQAEKSGIEILKNKLPSGPSPGSGNGLINNGGVKIGVKDVTLLKNKLPAGGSPGTGNAFMNNGGMKSRWREVGVLKSKLPSGGSPGTGH